MSPWESFIDKYDKIFLYVPMIAILEAFTYFLNGEIEKSDRLLLHDDIEDITESDDHINN